MVSLSAAGAWLACRMRGLPRLRLRLRLTTLALLVMFAALCGIAAAATRSHGSATKIVRYHGYRLVVPASWPVYNLAADPAVCVRFNRHAVYLGQPSSHQRCPAHAVGRTGAILVAPLAARSAGAGGVVSGPALPGAANPDAQPLGGSSAELTVPSSGVEVTATWHGDRAAVERALGVRSLSSGSPRPTRASTSAVRIPAVHKAGDPVYTGLGFDACSTPSASAMSAWGASPFRAVGFYIGGVNEACSQPNLSPTWVDEESAAGWALLPIYVGLQAPKNGCGCAAIVSSQASTEGTAAADDAIDQAEANGLSPGNPIYDDMEAYTRGTSNTSAVLAYLSAWTSELHAHGYLSGVYSSENSGIVDLVNANGTGFLEPDELWIANWNGQANTNSSVVPSTEWANHQRLHQYQGGHNATYGGVTINIDSDYVDADVAGGGALFPNGAFIQESGSPYIYEIAGGAPLLVSDWSDVGGAQPYTVITPQQFEALDPVPTNGTLIETNTGGVFMIAGGAPLFVSSLAVLGNPQPLLVDQWNIDNVGNPLSHLNALPSNGTFLMTTTGLTFRVAGGAPLGISNWSVFGGAKPAVTIDPWDVENLFNPAVHMLYRPIVGTVVQGLPSGAYWEFGPKNRYLVAAEPGAVRVADHGLVPFSAIPCRVPGLGHMTLAQAKVALIKADCRLGKVHDRPLTRRRHTLRVIKQVPKARTQHIAFYTVGLTLG
jgi:Rv2525c-like, glycoside hydrolase-like domain